MAADLLLHRALGLERPAVFAAVGGAVYRKAREQGLGRELPTEWFLQDIRD